MKPLLRLVICVACILTPLVPRADAQVGAIGVVFAGKKISEIIDQIKQTGVSLLAQADNTGNALISHGANEANVLAQNLSFQFRDRLNDAFERLSDQEKLLLVEAEGIRLDLQRLGDRAYDAKDTLAIDLNYLVTRFPFVGTHFFVQSIRGVAYFPGNSDYKMRVFASTLGIQEDINTTISLKLAGQQANSIVIDQAQQRGQALITLPNSLLGPKFKDKELVLLPATLTFEVQRRSGWWIFSRMVKDAPYDVPITLSLYPRTAATVTPMARAPKFGWTNLEPRSSVKDTPDRHCSSNCRGEPTRGPNRIEMVVAGGDSPVVGHQKFVPPMSLQCIGGGFACEFNGAQNTIITDNGARAVATWDTWSRPTTWRLTSAVQEYRLSGDEPWTGVATDIKFGQVASFDFPNASTVKTLKVRTFTKNEYEIVIGTADPASLLIYRGREAQAPQSVDRHVYQIQLPQDSRI